MTESVASSITPRNSDAFTPKARWDLRFRRLGVDFHLETDESRIEVTGIDLIYVQRIVHAIDGNKTVAEIATVAELTVSETAAFLSKLEAHRLVFYDKCYSDSPVRSKTLFETCRQLYPDWKARLFSHPLWVQMATGEAGRNVFMGWLIESYFFIEGANDRMSLAVSECTHPKIREVLAHHYVEEWDHGAFFLKSLNEFGLSCEKIAMARPLPSTTEVLNYMRRCARLGPVYYAVCSGFLESTGTDREGAREFYRRLTTNYAQHNPGIVKPMADHTDLDEAYGHGDMLEQMMEHVEPMSEATASQILEAGLRFVELLEVWSSDILKTYSRDSANVRLPNEPYRQFATAKSEKK